MRDNAFSNFKCCDQYYKTKINSIKIKHKNKVMQTIQYNEQPEIDAQAQGSILSSLSSNNEELLSSTSENESLTAPSRDLKQKIPALRAKPNKNV